MEILPLKRCDAESIYSTLIEWLKKKGRKMVVDICRKHSGVQAQLKKHTPHAIFVHCHCHKLQLAIVQAANSTNGIKHMYTTLTSLWKFIYHSPKRCENLKEVHKVLDLPELKITKPSGTRWLAHERCVSTVSRCYGLFFHFRWLVNMSLRFLILPSGIFAFVSLNLLIENFRLFQSHL